MKNYLFLYLLSATPPKRFSANPYPYSGLLAVRSGLHLMICVALLSFPAGLAAQLTAPRGALKLYLTKCTISSAFRQSIVPAANIKFEPVLNQSAKAPEIEVALNNCDADGKLIYLPVAAWQADQKGGGQLSTEIWVKNKEAKPIEWQKVVFEYLQGGVAKTHEVKLDGVAAIPPGKNGFIQNSRGYQKKGDVVYFSSPLPTTIAIKLYFKGYAVPVKITKKLAAYNIAYDLPFKAFDLRPEEVWESGSTHGGGNQVFAHDMGVYGCFQGNWSHLMPGTDGKKNYHFRVWGKPIYAMADGVVKSFCNDVPDNPNPGESDPDLYTYRDPKLGDVAGNKFPYPGCGNHFFITHPNGLGVYLHLRKGSLNPALMKTGAVVRRGDFLGVVGNSGSSSAPHLHLEVPPKEGALSLPLVFQEGYVVSKSAFTTLSSSAKWTPLTNDGLPGLADDRPWIWPGPTPPWYGPYTYTAVFAPGSGGHYLWTGVDSNSIMSKDAELKKQGLRMTDLSVARKNKFTSYTGVWGQGSGKSLLQPGTDYKSFTSQRDQLVKDGYRLIDLEVYWDNSLKFAGLYGEGTGSHDLIELTDKAAFFAEVAKQEKAGLRLVDLELIEEGIVPPYKTRIYGVFLPGRGSSATTYKRRWSGFSGDADSNLKAGRVPIDLEVIWGSDEANGSPLLKSKVYSAVFRPQKGGFDIHEGNFNSFVSRWDYLTRRGQRVLDVTVH